MRPAGTVEIGRAQARLDRHTTEVGRTTLRLRLTQLLSKAELQPATLPPSAILIVRRLADPLPGHLVMTKSAIQGKAAWERAAREALAALYHRASRPFYEPVPASAEAVLFADEGEWLACLVLDLRRGEAETHWWWRAILRTLPSAGLAALLSSRASVMPAMLHYLAGRRQAATVMEGLSPQQAMAILTALSRAYGLPDLGLDLVTSETQQHDNGSRQPSPAEEQRSRETSTANASPYSLLPTPYPSPNWPELLAPPGLGKERACLLGVGLSLYMQPSLARSNAFLNALREWWRVEPPLPLASPATEPVTPLPPSLEQSDPGSVTGLETRLLKEQRISTTETRLLKENGFLATPPDEAIIPVPGLLHPPEEKAADISMLFEDVEPVADAGRQDGSKPEYSQEAGTEIKSKAWPGPGDEHTHQPAEPMLETGPPESSRPRPQGQIDRQPQPAADPEQKSRLAVQQEAAMFLSGGVETRLGGVLYLINLMAYLDLPACFEADWSFDSQIDAWGVLELLGRGLLAGDNRASPTDPLWLALAQLAGRAPGELPGMNFLGSEPVTDRQVGPHSEEGCNYFQNSRRFRLPPAWVKQLPARIDAVYYWATRRQRLRLWTAPGYILLDCPQLGRRPKAQVEAELQDYLAASLPVRLARAAFDQAPLDDFSGPLVTGLNPVLAHWLELVLPYLRLRLQLALSPAAEGVDLAQLLLLYPGRLYVTSTHVDLVMRLEDISLPVRLAGLDRNPGWLPEFGRVVLFHFE